MNFFAENHSMTENNLIKEILMHVKNCIKPCCIHRDSDMREGLFIDIDDMRLDNTIFKMIHELNLLEGERYTNGYTHLKLTSRGEIQSESLSSDGS